MIAHRRRARGLVAVLVAVAAGGVLSGPAHADAQPQADLAIVATVDVPTATVDDVVEFTLEVTNQGPDADPAVVVTDALPTGLGAWWADSTQGSCTAAQTVVCELGPIASGDSAIVTVAAFAEDTGVQTDAAQVSGAGVDESQDDNFDSATVTVVNHQADLSITNTASTATAAIGDLITYTMHVANDGPFRQGQVILSDSMSPRLTVVSAATTQGTCTPAHLVSCDLGRIDPGGDATVTVVARADNGGSLSNVAFVSGNSYGVDDPREDNNEARATVAVTFPLTPPRVVATPQPIVLGPGPLQWPAGTAPVNRPLAVATRITVRHRGRRISGRVTSVPGCMARRSVVLRRPGQGTRSYGRARTRAGGAYTITTRRPLRGRLYVAVAAKTVGAYRCRAGRSAPR